MFNRTSGLISKNRRRCLYPPVFVYDGVFDIYTEGEILHNGKNLHDIDRDEYRVKGIGVIFQGYNLLLNLTAVENIVLSMNISESDIASKKEKYDFEKISYNSFQEIEK